MIPTLPDDYFFHLRFKMESVIQSEDIFGCLRVNNFTRKKKTRNGNDVAKLFKTISRGGVGVLDLGPPSNFPPTDKFNNFARSCLFLVLFFLVKCVYQKTSKSVFVLRRGLRLKDVSILCSRPRVQINDTDPSRGLFFSFALRNGVRDAKRRHNWMSESKLSSPEKRRPETDTMSQSY